MTLEEALEYREELVKFALSLCKNMWDAEDIVQTAYEKRILRHHDKAKGRGFLYQAVKWSYADLLKDRYGKRYTHTDFKKEPMLTLDPEDEQYIEEGFDEYIITQLDVQQCLELLNETQRLVVLTCLGEGVPVSEIAKRNNKSLGTCKTALYRGRHKFINEWKD